VVDLGLDGLALIAVVVLPAARDDLADGRHWRWSRRPGQALTSGAMSIENVSVDDSKGAQTR
jgi:hypothetical protein